MSSPMPPYDPGRGLISCFDENGHSGDNISTATSLTLRDLIVDIYEEAFRRLPIEDMPDDVDLAHLVDRGGLCLGLLDPVTNIILNTGALLPQGFQTSPSPVPSGPSSSASGFMMSSSRRRERRRDEWHAVAMRSSRALLSFMCVYCGLLTEEQAGRYLIWAHGDLATAVLLVEHELYAARSAPPDPGSGRTRNSLRFAAQQAMHPSPDDLVSLATAWLPLQRLQMLAPVVRQVGGGNMLTIQDVKTVLHVLRQQDDISAMTTLQPSAPLEEGVGSVVERTTSCADLGDGRIAYTTVTIVQRAGGHIASLRRPQDMDSMLSSYSTQAAQSEPGTMTNLSPDHPCASVKSLDTNHDPNACPYLRSLEMSLYGTIHGFYLKALAMLPSLAARHHIRGILVAGQCYGPMDPVSNIVVGALWYDANFPLPKVDLQTQSHDILDMLTMLRAMSRSLRGLVALVHATSSERMPLHEILKYLSYVQCDLSDMLQPHLNGRQQHMSTPNPFVAAAKASKHPQASAWAAFLASLTPTKLDRLRSLMMSATANNTALSHESLTQIYNILEGETSAVIIQRTPRAPRLCRMALNILKRKREAYGNQQRFIRGKIEHLLQEYAGRHPSEPKYDLDFVCGAAITGHMDQCYHVNFMAATKSSFKNTLFFAEFWSAYQDESKPSMCCRLPQRYDIGSQCHYGREAARKIAYPDHSYDYLLSGVTRGGLNDIEGILEADFVYFDSERDVELAKVMQRMAKKEEQMQRTSTGRHAQWAGNYC